MEGCDIDKDRNLVILEKLSANGRPSKINISDGKFRQPEVPSN